MARTGNSDKAERLWGWLVVAGAALVAWLGSRDYAGGWNDGSRLATVEALVDHHTLAIDQSIFVQVPEERSPYPAGDALLQKHGTLDKLWINGHFYSDKSPVPALLLAGPYWLWQQLTGTTAAEEPARFVRFMTLISSGLAYVIAVWCIFLLGGPLRLEMGTRLVLTASFALTTLAPVYAEHVNNHILLLAVASALMLGLAHLAERLRGGRPITGWLLALGTLAGLGYTIDLGVGPPLLVCLAAILGWRLRRIQPLLLVVLAALPWLVLHHAVNYAVGGTWKPANAVADYFDYPGCPFSPENMTGGWKHTSPLRFIVYLLALLFGKKGFIGHNLPVFLMLPGIVWLLRRRVAELPEALFALGWYGAVWLLYGAASNNYSGQCYSVRWFVPLLAPVWFLLALTLREWPRWLGPFLLLSAGGLALSSWMMLHGPWMGKMVPHFWPVQAAVLLGWCWLHIRGRGQIVVAPMRESEMPSRRAAA